MKGGFNCWNVRTILSVSLSLRFSFRHGAGLPMLCCDYTSEESFIRVLIERCLLLTGRDLGVVESSGQMRVTLKSRGEIERNSTAKTL